MRLLLALLFGLLLGAPAARAQPTTVPARTEPKPAPAPRRPQRTLTVHLPLPTLVARLGEAAGLLEGPASQSRRNAAAAAIPANPVLVLTLPLPKIFSTQVADAPAPAAP